MSTLRYTPLVVIEDQDTDDGEPVRYLHAGRDGDEIELCLCNEGGPAPGHLINITTTEAVALIHALSGIVCAIEAEAE